MQANTTKVKIVHVIADSKLGGGPVHVLNLLKNINKDKFDCYLVCPEGYLSEEAKSIPKVCVENIPLSTKFDLKSFLTLKKIIGSIRVKQNPFARIIIHSHGPRAGIFATYTAPKDAVKVYTEHIYDGNYVINNSLNGFIQSTMLNRVYRKSDFIIAVSNAVKTYLTNVCKLDQKKIVVIPNGIELEDARNSRFKIQDSIIMGNIANFYEQKGHSYLIKAFAKIVESYPNAILELIGDGPLKKVVEAQVHDLGISNSVRFFGVVKNPIDKMKSWSVFILPSLSEPFGIVILEAMQAGVPVVASKVGGIVDIVKDGENGVLVKAGDSNALAKGIISVIEDRALSEKLVKAGFETIKKFNWQNIVKEYERIYSQ